MLVLELILQEIATKLIRMFPRCELSGCKQVGARLAEEDNVKPQKLVEMAPQR